MKDNGRYEKKLKECLMEILNYYDQLCKENNLTYYLGGGTLLGSIRHDGFIPWDDDIDVYMPREDYDKFLKLCISDKRFWVDNYHTNSKNWNSYSKIRYLNTEYWESVVNSCDCSQGIWIDIFPIDNSKNNFFSFLNFRKKIVTLCYSVLFNKNTKKLKDINSFFKKSLFIFMKLIPNRLIIFVREFMMKCENNYRNNYFISFGSRYSIARQLHLKSEILPLKTHIFENRQYPVPNNYDYVLKKIYGCNYMKLPPENMRVTHYPKKVRFCDGEEFLFDEKI